MVKNMTKDKTLTTILLLVQLIGLGGLHRMYHGKWISGIIWFLTGGLFLIGWIIDLYTFFAKNSTDWWLSF